MLRSLIMTPSNPQPSLPTDRELAARTKQVRLCVDKFLNPTFDPALGATTTGLAAFNGKVFDCASFTVSTVASYHAMMVLAVAAASVRV